MPIYSLGERRVEFRGTSHYIAPDATLAGSIALDNLVSIWFGVTIRAEIVERGVGPLLAEAAKQRREPIRHG